MEYSESQAKEMDAMLKRLYEEGEYGGLNTTGSDWSERNETTLSNIISYNSEFVEWDSGMDATILPQGVYFFENSGFEKERDNLLRKLRHQMHDRELTNQEKIENIFKNRFVMAISFISILINLYQFLIWLNSNAF